jgi:single-stranded-DNA-specific exonuclease
VLANEVPRLARELRVPPLVARLLWLRGIRTEPRARRFLRPRLADLSPPEDLPDLDVAAERLARATLAGEPIVVCGDYDVDGMTGTALLVRFFRLAGAEVRWSIPDRERDGYGLSRETVERLAATGARVLVTVDNGISAADALERAAALGVDAVVTDHHLPSGPLPPACAIVNPHLGDGAAMCGCALAFKLAWAVADRLRSRVGGRSRSEAFRAFLRDAVGLVALATVADVIPLRGENRILVARGLASLRASEHPGIRALLDIARVGDVPLTTEDVAFKIAPRLNAAGRLCKPDLVVELLTESDAARCQALARELDAANRTRRTIEMGVLKQAEAEAGRMVAERDPRALVVWGQGWHVGVIGIVAARLVDRYARPAAVIGFDGESGRGSCRTPPGLSVHAALESAGDHLERFGGHDMAAGLDIRATNADAFREAFEAAVDEQLAGRPVRRTLHIDAETHVDEWNIETVESIRRLAPFGSENPEPVFVLRAAEVAGTPRLMGQSSSHLSFALRQQGGAIRVVGFRQAAHYDLAASGRPLDLVVTPTLNDWRGVRTAEFRLVDMRIRTESDQSLSTE